MLIKKLYSMENSISHINGNNLFKATAFISCIGLCYNCYSINNKKDSSEARVWKQYPQYHRDRKIQLGSYIDLWLTVDSAKLPRIDTTKTRSQPNEGNTL